MRKILTTLFLPVFFVVVLVLGLYFFTRLGLGVAYNNANLRRNKLLRQETLQKNRIVN